MNNPKLHWHWIKVAIAAGAVVYSLFLTLPSSLLSQTAEAPIISKWVTRLGTPHGEAVIRFEVKKESAELIVINPDVPNQEPVKAEFSDGVLVFKRSQTLIGNDFKLNFKLKQDGDELKGTLGFQVVGAEINGERHVVCQRLKSDLESRVDTYLQPYLATNNFSGSILIARKDQVLLCKGYGFADREREIDNGPETVFHLCSVSRIFTSAAIMLLEQQGKLALDDKLSKHIPDWPRGDEITIHHLLTLSAGFPNINTLPGYWSWSSSPQTPLTLCNKFRDLPLEFEPGAKSVHSNSNYNVLALLIEKVSKKKFGQFLQDELFAPLEMKQTAHDDHADRTVPHEAIGYRPVGRTDIRVMPTPNWTVKSGNGSMYSTVEDLYKFDRMLVHNRLLDENSTTGLFTEHFSQNGYGWIVSKDSEGKTTSVNISGRSPGFGATRTREIESDITVILLGNLYSSATISIGRDLTRIAKGEQVETKEIRQESPPPEVLEEFKGAYQFGSDFYRPNGIVRLHVTDGHLFDGRNSWLIPAGDAKFINRTYWSDLEFVRDQSGKVVTLKYDEFIGKRIN